MYVFRVAGMFYFPKTASIPTNSRSIKGESGEGENLHWINWEIITERYSNHLLLSKI